MYFHFCACAQMSGALTNKMKVTRICLNLFLLVLAMPQKTWQNSTTSLEMKLLESLLNTNTPCQIPKNGTDPLLVDITVVMSNVLEVDILKYTISSVLLLNQSWYNKQLAWDEAEFPFATITVPWNSVWTPSLTVQESFDIKWKTESPEVVLHSDGKVEFMLALRIDTNCNFDLFYYPRDNTRCTLSFYALANKVNEMEFKVSIENQVLNVKREYLVTDVKVTSLKNMPQPCFVVMVNLKNTGIRTLLSLVVPSIALLVADLCGFLIPLQDRLSYMITLLLAYLVFHSSLISSLPGSSSCNPLLIYYYIGLLVLLFLSTIETVLVTKLVANNSNRWLNYGFQQEKGKATTMLPEDQSYNAEHTRDPGTSDCGTVQESSHLKQASAGVDKLFFIIYLGLVVMFHFLFAALWLLWKCESERPPGEDHLDGIKWRHDG
ncbi:zinc-activated ligand-gated ion channel isoform X2 [Rhineura floridana]|uniref:zinc-activated ligand-gated ion channel isoform X2 n=1 Tax=Rhineura floridana TaxID=261503 RepID=UPI002AC83AA9|nr:zinc-activated ligand-gated ion channel isoform X2 [Rhineura floridana]